MLSLLWDRVLLGAECENYIAVRATNLDLAASRSDAVIPDNGRTPGVCNDGG